MNTLLAQNITAPKPHNFSNPPAIEDTLIGISPMIVPPIIGVIILTLLINKFFKTSSLRGIMLGLLWLPLIAWLVYWMYELGRVYFGLPMMYGIV